MGEVSVSQLVQMTQLGLPVRAQVEVDGLVGLSLIEAAVKSDPKGLVPAPVRLCKRFLMKQGLLVEGIFRKPGSVRKSKELLSEMSNCYAKETFDEAERKAWSLLENEQGEPMQQPHDVASTMIKYLRALPEPLLTARLIPVYAKAIADYNTAKMANAEDTETHATLLMQIQVLMKLLPAANRATLIEVVELCTEIASHADINLMTAVNLGLCIGCTVAQPETLTFIIDHKEEILYGQLRQIDVGSLEKAMSALSDKIAHRPTTPGGYNGASSPNLLQIQRISQSPSSPTLGRIQRTYSMPAQALNRAREAVVVKLRKDSPTQERRERCESIGGVAPIQASPEIEKQRKVSQAQQLEGKSEPTAELKAKTEANPEAITETKSKEDATILPEVKPKENTHRYSFQIPAPPTTPPDDLPPCVAEGADRTPTPSKNTSPQTSPSSSREQIPQHIPHHIPTSPRSPLGMLNRSRSRVITVPALPNGDCEMSDREKSPMESPHSKDRFSRLKMSLRFKGNNREEREEGTSGGSGSIGFKRANTAT